MTKTVKLTLINEMPGIPAQITVTDFDMKQYARTILSGDAAKSTVAIPEGRYIVSIDRQDLPSEQRVETMEHLHVVRIGSTASEVTAAEVAAAEPRLGAILAAVAGSAAGTFGFGAHALASRPGFSDTIGFIKGLGPIWAEGDLGRPVRRTGPKPRLRLRRGASYQPPAHDPVRISERSGNLHVRAPLPERNEGNDPSARFDLPLAMLNWPVDRQKVLVLSLPLFHQGVQIDLRNGLPVDLKPTQRTKEAGLASLLDTLAADVPLNPDAVWRASLAGRGLDGHGDDLGQADLFYVAFRLLRDKFFDPYAAALAGHFLLRFRDFDKVSSWTRNLADYFPYISDGCVLEGWRRLQGGRKSNTLWPKWRIQGPPPPGPCNPQPNAPRSDNPVEDAARRFTEATARGRPIFYYGISRLMDGLYFCLDRLEAGELHSRVRDNIETVSSWQRGSFSLGGITAFEMAASDLSEQTQSPAAA